MHNNAAVFLKIRKFVLLVIMFLERWTRGIVVGSTTQGERYEVGRWTNSNVERHCTRVGYSSRAYLKHGPPVKKSAVRNMSASARFFFLRRRNSAEVTVLKSSQVQPRDNSNGQLKKPSRAIQSQGL